MKKKIFFKLIMLMITITIAGGITFLGASVIKANASTSDEITIHYYSDMNDPYIYYWNSTPDNKEVSWPGKKMDVDTSAKGPNCYVYKFSGVDKINFLFNNGGEEGENQTEDLTQNTGDWWYKDGVWYPNDPYAKPNENDFREESIYFVMTARFYDGDSSNNVHCVNDGKAGNGDGDPAWRGDFKGLIDKLDYIKAMGFSAIWITPVVENASAFDFHGYHALNFSKVDPRLESKGATYQDLINACHAKGIKVIQDIVLNHSSNNGERGLFPIISQEYNLGKGVEQNSTKWVKDDPQGKLPANYDSLTADDQYHARDNAMKNEDYAYRKKVDISYEAFNVTTGQFDGECEEINTENPFVYNYLINAYSKYINMGVDAFRIDTTKHISRLTFNNAFIPGFQKAGGENFYMFGEVACRVSEVFNHGIAQVSPFYYTWKESKQYPWNSDSTDGKDNLELCRQAYDESPSGPEGQRTSNNVLLDGNTYHKPDHSQYSGLGVIDYSMHFNFEYASKAFNVGKAEDKYVNDSSYDVVYVDSHDYGPSIDGKDENRYAGGKDNWAENLDLMFTFRGIPCVYYGSEIEFKAGVKCDKGYSAPLEDSGRAYYGDHLEGTVNATDYSEYTNASGAIKTTLESPLSKHIQRLNKIRRAIPALQKGQYSTEGITGNMAYKRRYTDEKVDSYCLVTISDGATFSGILNGTYVDAITGDTKTVTNGSMSIAAPGKGNMRVYVLQNSTTKTGKIGTDGPYLK